MMWFGLVVVPLAGVWWFRFGLGGRRRANDGAYSRRDLLRLLVLSTS